LDIFKNLCEKAHLEEGFMVSYVSLLEGLINCNVLYKIFVSLDGECGVVVYVAMLFDGLVPLYWLILLFPWLRRELALPLTWRLLVPLKYCYLPTTLHGNTSHKTTINITYCNVLGTGNCKVNIIFSS
jgi:hypothetical protein